MEYYICLQLGDYKINQAGIYNNVPPFFINDGLKLKTLNINWAKIYLNFHDEPILTLKKNIKGSVGFENSGIIPLHYYEEAKNISRLRFVCRPQTPLLLRILRKLRRRRTVKEVIIIINRVLCYRKPIERI